MTSSHSRLAAVQAAVVAVLLVLVFATLLQPEDEGSIKAVEGPSGQSPSTLPGPDVYTGDQGNGGTPPGAGNGGPSTPGGGPGTPGTPGTPPAPEEPSGTEGLGLTGPEGTPEDETRPEGGGGPSEDQYLSALGRLTQDLE